MHELLPQVIFYGFSALAVLSAVMLITQNNPVRCALFLVLAFFASSILWILVSAEFLALILVLVYVGAVMTLFLFVIMMLNIDRESQRIHFLRYAPFGLFIVALLTGLLLIAIPSGVFQTAVEASGATALAATDTYVPMVETKALSNTEALGMVLYTDYVFAFELAAVILLVSIVAAITLVHRKSIHSKQQNIVRQIMTQRDQRVTLLNMPSEK